MWEYGLPHQPAGWFAMTEIFWEVRWNGASGTPPPTDAWQEGAVHVGGGVRAPRPTGAGHGGGVGKTPVRRGACVPRRWGCRACRAAAHMGAALQEITGRVRQIGRGRTPPLRIGWGCGAKGVRIATSVTQGIGSRGRVWRGWRSSAGDLCGEKLLC